MKYAAPALLVALYTCPGTAAPAVVSATVAVVDPVPITDQEFNAWSEPYIQIARGMTPDEWEMKTYRGSAASDRTTSPGAYAVHVEFSHRDVVRPPGPYGGRARIYLTISPKQFRQVSRLPPLPRWKPSSYVVQRRIHPASWIGSTADANFYAQSMVSHDQWRTFNADSRTAFGLKPEHSTIEDMLFELREGDHSHSLFEVIGKQDEAIKLRLARELVAELLHPRAPYKKLDLALSEITHQYPHSPASIGRMFMRIEIEPKEELNERDSREVARVWSRWIAWAETTTEEEWMARSLEKHIAEFRAGSVRDAGDSTYGLRRLYVELLPAEARLPQDASVRAARTVAWYDARKGDVAWNKTQQRFVLK